MERSNAFRTADHRFISDNVECAATLYQPVEITTDVPCVVLAPTVNHTRFDGYPRFAQQFAAAGYAALVVDYRYIGDSAGQPRQLVDYQQQRDDLRAAVAYARTLDGIDPARLVLWGFGFGGGHVITVGPVRVFV